MSTIALRTTLALALGATIPSAIAASIAGNVTNADGKAIEGAIVSTFDEDQRGRVGRLWQEKERLDPDMANRGHSFVRIMEHVANAGKAPEKTETRRPKGDDGSENRDNVESKPALSGTIRFEGPRPDREPINLTQESRKLYETPPLDETVLVNEKGELANVFVYIKEGLEEKIYPVPAEPAVVNQDKSMFRPRVQGLLVGQEFVMRNSDPFIHNVRSLSLKNRAFNIAQPARTPDRKRVFKKPEGPVTIKCDFHPWMTAHLFVMDHPYFAVTDEHGHFTIKDLPPGDYTLAAWHEEFGEQRKKIAIGKGASDVGFTFNPKK